MDMYKKSNMITADYMEEETFAFGLETEPFPSFFDETIEDRNSLTEFNDASSFDGLFSELGLPDEGVPKNWSLLEQLDMTSTENPSCNAFLANKTHSPHSSVPNETSFNEEYCLLSPLSDSGDSGVSSCHSPYQDVGSPYSSSGLGTPMEQPDHAFEQFDLSTTETPESNVDLLADLVREFTETSVEPELLPAFAESVPVCMEQNDCPGDTSEESVETIQVPFIEENKLSPDIVQEFTQNDEEATRQRPIHIAPMPVEIVMANRKMPIKRSEPNRVVPYPKKRPAKERSAQQKEKKKDQNRSAATKYRTKKKDELQQLFQEAEQLEETNKGLQEKVGSLTKEIDYLKGLMLDVIKAKLARSNSQQA